MPYSYTFASHPSAPLLQLTHKYMAGTKNPVAGTPGGIAVGTWTIRFWTDRIDHFEN